MTTPTARLALLSEAAATLTDTAYLLARHQRDAGHVDRHLSPADRNFYDDRLAAVRRAHKKASAVVAALTRDRQPTADDIVAFLSSAGELAEWLPSHERDAAARLRRDTTQ